MPLVIVNIITKFAVVIRVSFVKISLETSQVIMENNRKNVRKQKEMC